MRANYCKCNNTYTINDCDIKKCKQPKYWNQGVGGINNDDHSAIILNVDTNKTLSHTVAVKPLSSEGIVINIDTTRTI